MIRWLAADALAGAFLAVALLSPSVGRAEADPDRFAPLASLAGSCWSGTFDDGGPRDVHCFEWAIANRFLRDRHVVGGGEEAYEGETLYGWEGGTERLRFWYFNSLGGVSEGTVHEDEAGWWFGEDYRGGAGSAELRSRFARPDEDSYTVVTERRREAGWVVEAAITYRRLGVRPVELGGPWAERFDLVFNSNRSGDYEIYRRELGSGAERNLTEAPTTEWAYGSVGEDLIIVSDRTSGSEGGYRLYLLGAASPQRGDRGPLRRLADFPVADSWVGALPGGDGWVVCASEAGDRELFLLDARGSVVRKLTDNEADDCQPDVTPDGLTVVFWSDRGGSGEIWAMRLDGSETRQLTRFAANDLVPMHRYGGEGPPRISPDGTRIAWMSMRQGETFDVYTMTLDGSDVRRITEHLADDGYPSWSPDGRYLAFDSNRYGSFDLFVVEERGGAPHRITDHPGYEQAPIWVERKPASPAAH